MIYKDDTHDYTGIIHICTHTHTWVLQHVRTPKGFEWVYYASYRPSHFANGRSVEVHTEEKAATARVLR